MQVGTHVLVSGLQSRPDLNGRKGVAKYYVPASGKEGRYLVQINGTDENLGIKFGNLTICDHDESVDDDMLTVNGLNYCAKHRAEICGECGYDFRLQNRAAMLEPGEEVFDRAVKVDEEEAARNEPPLRAPLKGKPGQSAPHSSATTPVLNKNASVKKGLDPSKLDPWPKDQSQPDPKTGRGPLEQAFTNVFSLREKIMSHSSQKPSPSENPLYHVKESMLAIGARCDECFCENKPVPRFFLQDEAQTELIFIDVMDAKVLEYNEDKFAIPALLVRYRYCTAASNMRGFIESIEASMKLKVDSDVAMGFSATSSKKSGFQNMPSHVAEIALARSILDGNRKRLDPAYVERALKDWPTNWFVSVLLPICKEAEKPKEAKDVCAKCGKQGASLQTCAKCKVQKYCSRECQLSDWKMHKKSCVAPERDADADIVSVDLSIDPFEAAGMAAGMTYCTFSHDADASAKAALCSSMAARPSDNELPAADKLFVIKIQVPMLPLGVPPSPQHLRAPSGMMCYNAKRDLHFMITLDNCSDAMRLFSIVRSGSIANGIKGYFNAYLAGETLQILAHKPLALQPW